MAEGTSTLDINSPEFKEAAEKWLDGQGIKKALDSEREARRKLEGQVKQFEGVNLDEVKSLMEEKRKAEEEKARAAGDFEKLLKQTEEKFAKELQARDERTKGLQKSLEEALIDSAAAKAIAKFEGDAELLLPHVKASTRLLEVGGKHRAVVVGEDGEPMLAPDAKQATDYMGIEHLVGGWKEQGKFAGAFSGTGASGGGAPASTRNGGAGTPRRISVEDAARMDPVELAKGLRSGALQASES